MPDISFPIGSRRKICVVTGSRADYGILLSLLRQIAADPSLELQLVVTGMHLSSEFGLTYRVIEDDGFRIRDRVEILLSSDSRAGMAKSVGLGVISFTDALLRLCPDIIVLLGDRFEIFAAAQAAFFLGIPIAHIHGGELSEGSLDDSMRHSITKLSSVHFPATESCASRIAQMGENPKRIFNFGALSLGLIKNTEFLSRKQLETEIGISSLGPLFLVTYHPATGSPGNSEIGIIEILKALDFFPGAQVVFTKANADSGGRLINRYIVEYTKANPTRAHLYESLGQLYYWSVLKCSDVVIGNSSSGLIEAPALKTATVNVGIRQLGRERASSVIDCCEQQRSIKEAIDKALSKEFQRSLFDTVSSYGCGNSAEKIKEILANINLKALLNKEFYSVNSGDVSGFNNRIVP